MQPRPAAMNSHYRVDAPPSALAPRSPLAWRWLVHALQAQVAPQQRAQPLFKALGLPRVNAHLLRDVVPLDFVEVAKLDEPAVLVVQLASDRPTIPPFDKVKDQMMERAFGEATERQRKLWLTELRRGVYIDVRL